MLGVLFPEFDESLAWRRRGRKVLEERLPLQFHRMAAASNRQPSITMPRWGSFARCAGGTCE
jgi:hypothetical protein